MAEDFSNSRLMDQVAEELLKPFQEPIRSIYIDSDFLYDYRLGALLLNVHTQEQWDHVRACIPAYEKGHSRCITKYFPKLAVTEEELDMLEEDRAYTKYVSLAAPRTKFLLNFTTFLAKVNTYNHSKEIEHPIQVVINQRKHIIPDKIWDDFESWVHAFDPKIRLTRVHYSSWYLVPVDEIKSYSMLLVHDLVDFVRQGTASQMLLCAKSLLDKIVVSPYQTEEEIKDPKEEEIALENFANVMRLMVSEFSFIDKSIPVKGDV